MEVAKEKEKIDKQKKALALKEMRDVAIPIINAYVEKYSTQVKFLDTDAYIYLIEDGKERGIYIPYGKDDETELDIKIDNFVHDFGSASKHKAKGLLGKSADLFLKIGEGYDHLDEDMGRLEQPRQKKATVGGFWDKAPTVKDLSSPSTNSWISGKSSKIINTNTNPGNTLHANIVTNKNSQRKPIPEYIKEAVRKRAKHRCENPNCRISDREVKVEFHHVNGNHSDNRLENISYLCPNCHSSR